MAEVGRDLDKRGKQALRRLRDEIGMSERAAELVVRAADMEIDASTGRRSGGDRDFVSDTLARMPGHALARTLELPEQEVWSALRIVVPELLGVPPTPQAPKRRRKASPCVVVSTERRSWNALFTPEPIPSALVPTVDR